MRKQRPTTVPQPNPPGPRRTIKEALGMPPRKLRKDPSAVEDPDLLPELPEDVDPNMAERVTKLMGVRIFHFADGSKYRG